MSANHIGPELETGQFTVIQTHKDGFQHVYAGGLAKIEDEVVHPNLAQMTPCFEVRWGLLYCIVKGKWLGIEVVQLLVPKRYWWVLV